MIKFTLLLMALATAGGCIKTAEQVQKEKRYESMAEQMKDSQGLVSEVMGQLKDMRKQLDRMTGKIEEIEHRSRQIDPEQHKKMNENVALLQTQREADAAQMAQIQQELKEQRAFIEKVTTTLNGLNQTKAAAPAAKKKSPKDALNEALEMVKANKYKEARTELESLIDHKELNPGDHNKVFHGLGRVEFFTKNYEKALVYFSKIYGKYPKSSLAASSLHFIGKSLDKLGKKNEASEAFAKLVEDYPTSKEASEAKKEI
jgi:TolA-binding protein